MLALAPMLGQTKMTQAKFARAAIMNEVLLEKSFRYVDLLLGLVRPPFLFSTPFSFDFGLALVVSGSSSLGGMVEAEEERSLDPLTIVLADGNAWEVVEGEEKDLVEGE